MLLPRPLFNPGWEPLTCYHGHQEEGSPAPVHGEGCAVSTSVEEGVAMDDALRAQTYPYLTSYLLHIHETEYFLAEVWTPPERR